MDLELTIIWLAASTLITLGYIIYTQNGFIKLLHRKRAEKAQHAISDDRQSIDIPRKRQKIEESSWEESEDIENIIKNNEDSEEKSLQVINSRNDMSIEDFHEEIWGDTQVELPQKREYDLNSSICKKAEFYRQLKDDMPIQIQKLNESLARPNGRQLYIHSNFKDYSLYPFEEYSQNEGKKEKEEKNYVFSQSFDRYSEEIDFSVQKNVDFNCFKNWRLKRKEERNEEIEFEKPAIIPEEKSRKNQYKGDISDISSPLLLSALFKKNENEWSKNTVNSHKPKEFPTKNSEKDIKKIESVKTDLRNISEDLSPPTPTFSRKSVINKEKATSDNGSIKDSKNSVTENKIPKPFTPSTTSTNDISAEKSSASPNSQSFVTPFNSQMSDSKLENSKLVLSSPNQDAPSPFSTNIQCKSSLFSSLSKIIILILLVNFV